MEPIIITLEGNIGAGKSTLLEAIGKQLPFVSVIQEPVGTWLSMKNEKDESLLSLFYKDKERWAYTFQNCALLTRLLETQKLLDAYKTGAIQTPIIITERSILTDRHVFAKMMYTQGKMDKLEWDLYLRWFDAFASKVPVRGIIYLSTNATTSKERIVCRNRNGEESIPLTYLEDLDHAHQSWICASHIPTIRVNTEPGTNVSEIIQQISEWLQQFL